jgi:hypothetical protein
MSERTDRIIDDHLNQRPTIRHSYQHDPTLHHQVEWARRLLAVIELVMQREGIEADAGERVLNEVIHVGFGDWEQEQLRRERDLIFADIDPPSWIKRVRREQETEALWEMNRAALDRAAEQLSDRLGSSEGTTT